MEFHIDGTMEVEGLVSVDREVLLRVQKEIAQFIQKWVFVESYRIRASSVILNIGSRVTPTEQYSYGYIPPFDFNQANSEDEEEEYEEEAEESQCDDPTCETCYPDNQPI